MVQASTCYPPSMEEGEKRYDDPGNSVPFPTIREFFFDVIDMMF
jgi:hypothetical protein